MYCLWCLWTQYTQCPSCIYSVYAVYNVYLSILSSVYSISYAVYAVYSVYAGYSVYSVYRVFIDITLMHVYSVYRVSNLYTIFMRWYTETEPISRLHYLSRVVQWIWWIREERGAVVCVSKGEGINAVNDVIGVIEWMRNWLHCGWNRGTGRGRKHIAGKGEGSWGW